MYATIVPKMGAMLVLRRGLNPLTCILHHVAMHSLHQCTHDHTHTLLTTPWLEACFRARQAGAKAQVQPSSDLWVVSVEEDGDTHPAGVMSTAQFTEFHVLLAPHGGCSSLLSVPLQLCCPHLLRDENGLSSSLQLPSGLLRPQHCCDLSTALDPATHVYPYTILFSIGPDSCGSLSQDTDSLLPSSDPECLTGLHTAQEKLVPLSFLRSKDATQDLGESNKQPWPLLADSKEDM